MKKIIVIITLCLAYSVNAQVAMSRYIQVKDGQREQFIKSAAMKTKIFNSVPGQTKFYTFSISCSFSFVIFSISLIEVSVFF